MPTVAVALLRDIPGRFMNRGLKGISPPREPLPLSSQPFALLPLRGFLSLEFF
jgi:hypothetical protein